MQHERVNAYLKARSFGTSETHEIHVRMFLCGLSTISVPVRRRIERFPSHRRPYSPEFDLMAIIDFPYPFDYEVVGDSRADQRLSIEKPT